MLVLFVWFFVCLFLFLFVCCCCCCCFFAGINPSRTSMSGSFESVRWNACVHRLDLSLYSHPKEFWGNGVRTHVHSQGQIPSTGRPEEDRTHDAASSRTASRTRYRLSYSGPRGKQTKQKNKNKSKTPASSQGETSTVSSVLTAAKSYQSCSLLSPTRWRCLFSAQKQMSSNGGLSQCYSLYD